MSFSLVVADSGQIEARVVAWFAGERAVLDTFRRNDASGGDFYSDEGSRYFGKKLSKKETPLERQISKSMILGLGFEMGWSRFGSELLKGLLGADPVRFTLDDVARYRVDVPAFKATPYFDGTRADEVHRRLESGVRLSEPDAQVHFAVAAHFVALYRRTNTRIAATWKACGQAIELMANMAQDRETRFGCLRLRRHAIVKPSGLVLRYPGLRKTSAGYVYLGGDSGREWTKIYGGLLTENLVQSLARDVVAEQMLAVRADGYKVATTTHDEIVAVVPDEEAPRALERMIAHMRTPPAWCADLPLNAEGSVAKRYGDAK